MCGVRGGEREEGEWGSRVVMKSLSEMFKWVFGVVPYLTVTCMKSYHGNTTEHCSSKYLRRTIFAKWPYPNFLARYIQYVSRWKDL